MTGKPLPPPKNPKLLQQVRFIAIALLVLAICFRFAHLDRKVYWHDEAYTSTVITARPGKYFNEDIFKNTLAKPADLLAYQRFVPDLALGDMVVRKGTEDVQHPPVYYLLLRFWAQWWGTAPAVTRSFSALLSLLIFPALYWLCWELFESRLSGWVAIALFAVSPFHLVFGQEVRQFGFWTVLTLVCSALLLRAIRSSSWRNWAWYGVSMLVASYTALFTLGVAVGHFAYVLFVDSDNRFVKLPLQMGKRTISCFITLLLVALFFIPWISFIITSRDTLSATTSWTSISPAPLTYLQALAFNFSRSFVDFNAKFSDSLAYILAIPILILQGYALSVVCRNAPKKIYWFILTFVGSTALILWLPDLLLGGQRLTVIRYPIVCYVGLQLAVVYLLSAYLTETQKWKSSFAKLVFSLLILLGILSCGVYSQANTWWNKDVNSNYHQLANLINESDRPLIIADAFSYYPISLISLSYLLKPNTQLLLLPAVGDSFSVQSLPEGVETIFLFNLPEVFRQQFESRFQKKLIPAFQDPWNEVWKAN
ncbi:glycosyltransferase family 39 protein [Leptolyngbya sp. FACHB-711]|uniref:glycosyltransferase family 39 protein n=1 Tax=unclassified Leptolyngbya TaxID=2650499 RepID=UPI001688993F|nr:glycosyltransferase family 39 protein [Cyanobacteria bacterium FACHB-502]MBD2027949.1 glycosyltransferase family 39 protein [Leptolyngbya sp. FACHB-711]